jgi:hypothetical protein
VWGRTSNLLCPPSRNKLVACRDGRLTYYGLPSCSQLAERGSLTYYDPPSRSKLVRRENERLTYYSPTSVVDNTNYGAVVN